MITGQAGRQSTGPVDQYIKRRRAKRLAAAKKALGWFITFTLACLLGGLLLMLAVNMVHNSWLASVPTVGYWTASLLVAYSKALYVMIVPGSRSK